MIKVRIVSGSIVDEVIAGLPVETIDRVNFFMKTEGKAPGQVFDSMIALDLDWEVEYDQATDAEYGEWAVADVVSRQVRAVNTGKTIVLKGETISPSEFLERLLDFMEECHQVPHIISDNSESLILGILEEEEEGEKLS